ncbi:MAG TPA: cyclic nucleotide-binding domain-containing protein [Anaerolineae bacterium]|nr:cyclic nucleotide-binding domain-containing protein [Anaerolineae bacterium]HQH37133.1 cyclic nucleotide-binding domain-containing protein [Anaerolineae bacterium]
MEPKEVLTQLRKVPLFRGLTDAAGEDVLMRMTPFVRERIYDVGERILTQDQPPDRLCILVEGKVRLTRVDEQGNVTPIAELKAGEVFGRTELVVQQLEGVNAEAVEKTRLLYMLFRELVKIYDQSDLLRKLLPGPLQLAQGVAALKQVPLFQDFRDERAEMELYRIAPLLHDQVYGNGEWLFRQGEIAERLLIVLEGRIQLTKIDPDGLVKEVGWLEVGDVAGETGLLVGDFHDVLATADGQTRVLYLLRDDFAKLLQERPRLWHRLHVSETVSMRHKTQAFEWLRDDEWTVFVVQRHWSRLFRRVAVPLLFLILLTPVLYFLSSKIQESPAASVLTVVIAMPIAVLVVAIFWQYMNWRDDYFVLTTQRVVHIERTWPFAVKSEECPLDNIQDIHEVRAGATANILNYGNLVLQTAGETVDIDIDNIPDPAGLRMLIFQQIERLKARDLLRSRGQIRDLLARRLKVEKAPTPPSQTLPVAPAPRRPLWLLLTFSWLWEYLFPPSWLETGEGGTIILRRYWLIGLLRYLGVFVPLAVVSIGGAISLFNLMEQGSPHVVGWVAAWAIVEVILLSVLLWLIEDWRNDYVQLTPSHVILVKQKPLLLQESRREARLDRIQNLSFQVPGFWGQLLKFGHVQFETAGREGLFELRWVRYPAKIRSLISDRQYTYNQQQRQIEATRRQDELLSWFATYDNLRKESE